MISSQTKSPVPHRPAGQFVISLDFELYWGVLENKTVDGYGTAIRGARSAVLSMLELFRRYEIQATWATVGLLFFDDAREARDHLPMVRPKYRNTRLDPFRVLETLGSDPSMTDLLFAKDLVREIDRQRGQEIGTHTFSHYYCWDDDDEAAFDADLAAACAAAARLGIDIKSLVFPRNQIRKSYLPICHKHGITSFRDRPTSAYYAASGPKWTGQLKRACRIADSFIKAGPSHLQGPRHEQGEPVSIIGSRFLRADAVSSPFLRDLHARRIKNEMTKAAKEGGIFHLWWHPHNFGTKTEAKFAFLGEILDHYQSVHARYGMASSNMGQLAEKAHEEVALPVDRMAVPRSTDR